MKIALLQPDLSEKYSDQKQAYGSGNRPPETGLAVLDSWVRAYGKDHEVRVLDPRKSSEELSQEASNYDLLGMSDWFSNHGTCIEIAEKAKAIKPKLQVVLGGANASLVAQETMNNYKSIDYVISRDGEKSLLGLAEGRSVEEIPNLWYRDESGQLMFTYQSFTSLNKMPVWDFSNFQNADERLGDYLKAQEDGLDPWLVPPLTLFSFRGCSKAMREGVCKYCTSSETRGRALPAEKLWDQIVYLNQKYGAEIFYMADDIFTVSPKRIKDIAQAKPGSARAKIRAYGYLPDLAILPQSRLEEMAEDLEQIGVFNLFYGSETYDPSVLEKVNKKGISVDETVRIIETLKRKGNVKTTIAYLLGLPGESRESLQINIDSFRKLLDADDCLERLYISVGMPLKGTAWCQELQSDQRVRVDYENATGKNLVTDDDPDYDLLSKLAIKYQTSVSPQEVNDAVQNMVDIALTKIPEHRVGGFMVDV